MEESVETEGAPKVKVFAWKVIHNGLPTRANRNYRHLDPLSVCEICGLEEEDVFHALIRCPHAIQLRQETRRHWVLPPESELTNTGPEWLVMLCSRFPVEMMSNFLMLLWRSWYVRNSWTQARVSGCLSKVRSSFFSTT